MKLQRDNESIIVVINYFCVQSQAFQSKIRKTEIILRFFSPLFSFRMFLYSSKLLSLSLSLSLLLLFPFPSCCCLFVGLLVLFVCFYFNGSFLATSASTGCCSYRCFGAGECVAAGDGKATSGHCAVRCKAGTIDATGWDLAAADRWTRSSHTIFLCIAAKQS